VSSDNGHQRRRPIISSPFQDPYTAETFKKERDQKEAIKNRLRAQAQAKEEIRQEDLQSGGDESLYKELVMDPDDIEEAEDVPFSASGLMLDSGIHRISGPPGIGKSRLAYWEVIQRVSEGQPWAILDAEMGQRRYKHVMLQLGATNRDLHNIMYMDAYGGGVPDQIRHGRALMRILEREGYHGILYDSQIAFLGASGISENDAHEVRTWTMAACTGVPCAIVIDHTGHSDDSRGRGTSDKAAGCDVDLVLNSEVPFARGQSGNLRLTVNKDRSGTLTTGSSIEIGVECFDSGMEFVPGSWGISETLSISEKLAIFLLGSRREYATAAEMQKIVGGRKQNSLAVIREAVELGDIVEEKVGKTKRYSVAL
jgi:hypothetical protein